MKNQKKTRNTNIKTKNTNKRKYMKKKKITNANI